MAERLFDSHSDVTDVVRALPPDHARGLTFHLPLEIQALEYAGASHELIAERIDRRLPEAFANSLIDPPLYRWSEARYHDVGQSLASDDVEVRRRGFAQIVSLGPGLAGAAFHPIIRMAYGALRHDPHELSRGLAYLRTRREVLFAGRPATAVASDVDMPSAADLDGVSVFELIDFVAGEPAYFAKGDEGVERPEVATLATRAMGLVARNPSSFIAIHAVTGLHALAELAYHLSPRHELGGVPDDPLLEAWWDAMTGAIAASTIALETTAPERAYESQTYANLEALVATAVESPEVHDLKLSVALSRLVALGVTNEADALALGATKLAATESTT